MRNLLRLLAAVGLIALTATAGWAETCTIIPRAESSSDNIEMLIAPTAMSVNGIACYCDGDCVSPIATLALKDRAGNAIPFDTTLTCATGSSDSTWATISDSNRNLITGEGLLVSVSNSPASADRVTVCVRFD